MLLVVDPNYPKREHVSSKARCRYLMERRGMRPGLDFITVGCLCCFEVLASCKCDTPPAGCTP